MTVLLGVVFVAAVMTAVGLVTAITWKHVDLLRARAQKAEARADRAERRERAATERADTAEDAARQWIAHADGLAAQLVEHNARCLGVLVHENDGVKPWT